MNTIKENIVFEYEIKKSKFITLIYKIEETNDINKYLEECKKIYKDATHYCYAYKLGNTQRFSDDGEPGGTAGLPIMEVLNKKELNNVLCIVVRYFGGIKLGAGGLVRAYSKAIREAIPDNKIIKLIDGYLIKIESTYEEQKQLDYLFQKEIKNKEYNETITYYLEIEKNKINKLENYNYQIIEEIKIEKM